MDHFWAHCADMVMCLQNFSLLFSLLNLQRHSKITLAVAFPHSLRCHAVFRHITHGMSVFQSGCTVPHTGYAEGILALSYFQLCSSPKGVFVNGSDNNTWSSQTKTTREQGKEMEASVTFSCCHTCLLHMRNNIPA